MIIGMAEPAALDAQMLRIWTRGVRRCMSGEGAAIPAWLDEREVR